MADNGSTSIEVVRGEMQPWSDYTEQQPPASGPVLLRLLDDVLPDAATALIIGPHEAAVIEAVAARSARVTVLVRSVSDAATLAETVPTSNVTVITGALDGLELAEHGAFDVVVAADGLDRVLGADSDDLDWPQRLDIIARLAAGASLAVIACENEASLLNLLDRRPASERHGDDEWRPIYQDPRRPASPSQFTDALTRAGLPAARLYATFGPAGRPQALLDIAAAASATLGSPSAAAAVAALEAAARTTPLLASITDGTDGVIRAGLLGAMAPEWLALCDRNGAVGNTAASNGAGGDRGAELYVRMPGGAAVVSANLRAADGRQAWHIDRSKIGPLGDMLGAVMASPARVPAEVPHTESVERLLFRLAAAEDVPAFRALAGRLGEWLRRQNAIAPEQVVCFDDLFLDGDAFAWGFNALATTLPERGDDLVAAAWYRFQDRLMHQHRRHPWPPWTVGDDLVIIWLGMSGDEAPSETARGRELADAIAGVLGFAPIGDAESDPEVDLRTALADAAEARTQLFEMAGQVFGLERTISYRDRQLKSREKVIRTLRRDLTSIRALGVYQFVKKARKASRIRDPRKLMAAVKRRLPK